MVHKKKIGYFIIFLVVFFMANKLAAQSVEIRIKLIEMKSSTLQHLALSVSIVNHSREGVYIPGFDVGPFQSGFHLYIKKGKEFVLADVDLLGQYVALPTKCSPIRCLYFTSKASQKYTLRI